MRLRAPHQPADLRRRDGDGRSVTGRGWGLKGGGLTAPQARRDEAAQAPCGNGRQGENGSLTAADLRKGTLLAGPAGPAAAASWGRGTPSPLESGPAMARWRVARRRRWRRARITWGTRGAGRPGSSGRRTMSCFNSGWPSGLLARSPMSNAPIGAKSCAHAGRVPEPHCVGCVSVRRCCCHSRRVTAAANFGSPAEHESDIVRDVVRLPEYVLAALGGSVLAVVIDRTARHPRSSDVPSLPDGGSDGGRSGISID